MDDGSEVHPLVLLEGVGGDHIVGIRWIWQAPRHEIEIQFCCGGESQHTEVRGIDRVRAGTGGLTVVGTKGLRHRDDSGEPGDLRQRLK